LCIALGVAYPILYKMLPYQVEYHPYTVTHVVTQMQLLLFAALAFVALIKSGLYPAEQRSINLDTDWVYRRALPRVLGGLGGVIKSVDQSLRKDVLVVVRGTLANAQDIFNERGSLGRTWSTGTMAFWATILLAICLILYYL
jgi:multicomponent Na+:H+ antiporter subunit D